MNHRSERANERERKELMFLVILTGFVTPSISRVRLLGGLLPTESMALVFPVDRENRETSRRMDVAAKW